MVVDELFYQIWIKLGYIKWGGRIKYNLYRVWSWVGIKVGYRDRGIKEYEIKKSNY
jgi:hypothetical protein